MNILRVGSRIISRSNPVLLVATGAAIALSLPPVRKGLWSAAIFATRSLIKAKEELQSLGSRLQEEAEKLVAEARYNCDSSRSDCEMIDSMSDSARENGRELVETAVTDSLAVNDKDVN
jgi:hypothetical protein